MKRILTILAVFVVAGGALWANGNAEKVTTMEGTVIVAPEAAVQNRVMLQLGDGSQVEVMVPGGELQQLQIRDQQQIQIRGVMINADPTVGQQVRLYAREVVAAGKDLKVKEAIQLTQQDRERVRLQTAEETKTQTQTRSQSGNQGSGDSGSSGSKK
jgi:hypothetical protein